MILVELEDVRPAIMRPINPQFEDGARWWIQQVTDTLIGRFPVLRALAKSDPDHDAIYQAKAMIRLASAKILANPEALASETMGPFAHSKFDSADPFKELFPEKDALALAALLIPEGDRSVGSIKVDQKIYTNSYRRVDGYKTYKGVAKYKVNKGR